MSENMQKTEQNKFLVDAETKEMASCLEENAGKKNIINAEQATETVEQASELTEKKADFQSLLEAAFACSIRDIRQESPLTLAYIGDAVYDLMVRTVVVERANRSPKELHRTTVKYVNAATQARMIEALEPELTEEEMAVYHRGRNAKSGTSAKNASIIDYRKATGFEAVVGYLYLQGKTERAITLVKKALDAIEMML